jgi:hypothetical protein
MVRSGILSGQPDQAVLLLGIPVRRAVLPAAGAGCLVAALIAQASAWCSHAADTQAGLAPSMVEVLS